MKKGRVDKSFHTARHEIEGAGKAKAKRRREKGYKKSVRNDERRFKLPRNAVIVLDLQLPFKQQKQINL